MINYTASIASQHYSLAALVDLVNVFIHVIFVKAASHGSKGQKGIQAYTQLRYCHLIIVNNTASAQKNHLLL